MKWQYFILILFIIPFVSSVNLDSGVVLNTSESNSGMTFSVPITVDNFVINATTITLNTIICSNGASPLSQVNWFVPNANNDSASYCYVAPPAPAEECNSYLKGTLNLVMIFSALFLLGIVFLLLYNKGIIQNVTTEGLIITFVGVAIGIGFLISIGDSIFSYCNL